MRFEQDEYYHYDLREPRQKIMNPEPTREIDKTMVAKSTEDWSNIPYYPTMKERRETVANNLLHQGKSIPLALRKQIQEDREKEARADLKTEEVHKVNVRLDKRVTFSREVIMSYSSR